MGGSECGNGVVYRGIKLNACQMVKLRFRLGLVIAKPLAQHGALEYGSDLHVNERKKTPHSRYVY